MWLQCARYPNPLTGATGLPDPTKGEGEQDAELMVAFEICDEYRAETQQAESSREDIRQQTATLFANQGY